MNDSSVAHHLLRGALCIPRMTLTALIRGYQLLISPLLGPRCRFYPSCSDYALQAIARRGLLAGVGLAVWRVLRCQPWCAGGIDEVPLTGSLARGRWPQALRNTEFSGSKASES